MNTYCDHKTYEARQADDSVQNQTMGVCWSRHHELIRLSLLFYYFRLYYANQD